MNHDQVTERVDEIARRVAREPGISDVTFVVRVFARVREEAPEVIAFLRQERPDVDPYQALKWFLPEDCGYSTS